MLVKSVSIQLFSISQVVMHTIHKLSMSTYHENSGIANATNWSHKNKLSGYHRVKKLFGFCCRMIEINSYATLTMLQELERMQSLISRSDGVEILTSLLKNLGISTTLLLVLDPPGSSGSS